MLLHSLSKVYTYIKTLNPIIYIHEQYLSLSLNSEFSLREGNSLLSGLVSGLVSFELGQLSSDGSGLLGSQVLWLVLLTGVESSDVFSLVQVNDSQDTGNVLSDGVDSWQRWLLQLLDLKVGQFLL